MIGSFLMMVKLNRGFMKYQMRRTLWTTFSLLYVFMLSTVQIYNLYMGYIWVVVPLLSMRINSWITKLIHENRSEKKTPIHKFLPKSDSTSVIVSFLITGLFAFFVTGYLCKFGHLVCPMKEISLRPFDWKTCDIDPTFLPHSAYINFEWPMIHTSRPASLDFTYQTEYTSA